MRSVRGMSGVLSLVWALAAVMCMGAYADVPRPEHPFPQMVRAEWLNLNGVWEFAETDDSADTGYLDGRPFPDRINVPFCRESKLSGLARRGFINNVWYRRSFEVPANWTSPRVRLHIGACDWKTTVWLNGHRLGEHVGGSAPFWFDITPYLNKDANTVIVHAFDDVRSGLQAGGKQSRREESYGCSYTRVTGIWQTVWLEGVGESSIREIAVDTDPAGSRAFIRAEVDGPTDGLTLKATAYIGDKAVGTAGMPIDRLGSRMVLNLSEKRVWSPEDPFLYRLKLQLVRGGKAVDKVDSYFGLRSIAIRGMAILINDKAIFQRTVLDQGYYPDGVWTAPSDSDLRGDIELSMALGFNGARLHQKVFEPRFLYWADKLGYLVWGEYPNWGLNCAATEAKAVVNEWTNILRRDRNHPSIVGWCPFNETGAGAVDLQNLVVNVTRSIDPTRPIIDSSGWEHGLPNPQVLDAHDYDQNPTSFRARWCDRFGPNSGLPKQYGVDWEPIPFFVSEYGGIGWDTGEGGWGYGAAPKDLGEFYKRYEGLTNALLDSRLMFGFCYTQLTDVEQERNGLYTFDRKPKFDVARIKRINSRQAAYEKHPPVDIVKPAEPRWNVLVGAKQDGAKAKEWRYTLEDPADGWNSPGFDDSSWQRGRGAFGRKDGWSKQISTPWETKDIWLRQEFENNAASVRNALLVVHYDDATEVYLNGVKIWSATGWSDRYASFDVTRTVREALKPGRNLIAVHTYQDWGGQYIDLALLVEEL